MSTVYFDLSSGNLLQDWSNIGQITANDDWSGVPSIVGYRGDNPATSTTGVDPRSLTTDGTLVVDVIANALNPNTLTDRRDRFLGIARRHARDDRLALGRVEHRGVR